MASNSIRNLLEASEIYCTISQVVNDVEALVVSRKSFDYRTSHHKFVVAMSDLSIVAPQVESSECISVVPHTYSTRSGQLQAVKGLPLPVDFAPIKVCLYSQKTLRNAERNSGFYRCSRIFVWMGSQRCRTDWGGVLRAQLTHCVV